MGKTDIGHCYLMKHGIDLLNDTPFKQEHRRIPPSTVDKVREHLEQLFIWKTNHHWGSNIVLLQKTTDNFACAWITAC